jgi:FtsP/CotA-like multicopper oxidase with cupredoxin domain
MGAAMPKVSRRQVLLTAVSAAAMTGFGLARSAVAATEHLLRISAGAAGIMPGLTTQGIWGYGAADAPHVLRIAQGVPARILVTNDLAEVTTAHWHGLRVPHDQDGVPYLSQLPIWMGETYAYEFTPQDAGTYWFHPHCNTMEQIARGAAGVIVVEEAENPGFDADEVLQLRDFRLGSDGQFVEFTKPRNAARGGTLGTIITANWRPEAQLTAPAGGLLRLRLAVTDVTRVYRLAVAGAEARVVASDGHPVAEPFGIAPLPGADGIEPTAVAGAWPLVLAPGQRADVAIAMPQDGTDVAVEMILPNHERRIIARIHATGQALGRTIADVRPLPANPVSLPDLASAERLDFIVGWTPEGTPGTSGICGETPFRFWSINRKLWPGEGAPDPAEPLAPLATLTLGKSYIFRIRNETQNHHPIHLHGMAFRLLSSNRRNLPPVWSDTALLQADETVEIAFVADNPGDWVFHCHVIEHQKTGLAGLIRVA